MSYNEQETRFFLIDPVLRDKGYNDHLRIKMETPAPVEPTGPKGRRCAQGARPPVQPGRHRGSGDSGPVAGAGDQAGRWTGGAKKDRPAGGGVA